MPKKISNKKIKEFKDNLKKDFWERLKRNPDYKKTYEEYCKLEQFGKNPEEITVWFFEKTKKFRISNLIDPNSEYSDEIDKLIIFPEVLIKLKCFGIPIPLNEDSFTTSDDPEADPFSEGKWRKVSRSEGLFKGKYLQVLIDIDLPDTLIRQNASEAVKKAKEWLFNDLPEKVNSRNRLEENKIALRVFDLRESGKQFRVIAKEMWPKEQAETAQDKAKKYYRKAKKLIQATTS